MHFYKVKNEEFNISCDPKELDVILIHNYLSQKSYWAKNISYKLVEKSIQNSLNFGVYSDGLQLGYARIITDYSTFAYLCDVFMIDSAKGKGLSKWLIEEAIMAHPDLQNLKHWLLRTEDAQGLYSKFGWQQLSTQDFFKWMRFTDFVGY